MNFRTVFLINRLAMFVVYFWFGFLKVIHLSPATELVTALAQVTLPFIPAESFIVSFGIFECVIGVLWLFPKFTNIVFWLTVFHLVTTFMPMFFLPNVSWNQFFTPSLVGQYIIKNFVIFGAIYTLFVANKKDDFVKVFN
ncbi:hypothetical protein EGI22_05150 [Lacihabitans sp. LS3-19]|uniref:hypothetical protein n=1 Tax=Lacihabitans sp. LS3-19 TaxID=2487335 RepID=UPI0020CE615F|nr:hypothetical protein [Lacihabitans sp. LS3-19]MCP9767287.1 hypothetical protein [Lacihabitans sp. LS3-19]